MLFRIPEFIHEKFTIQAIFVWMLRVMAIFGIVCVGILIYAMFIEEPFIRYQNLPFPVETPVEQGRTVPIVIERCNDSATEQAYMSTRKLRNVDSDKEILLPNNSVSISPGCSRSTSRSVVIPQETRPGRYVIEGEVTFHGIIRRYSIPWYTETFEVIPMKNVSKQLDQDNFDDRIRQLQKEGKL